jgi:NAD-dependent dihydropyrimidine dehydrogenase PreA subunit
MKKNNIAVNPEKCTECICCQLICSLTYAGAFNPEEARIVIKPPQEISFTDECVKGCSLCTKYCVYGAITLLKG